MEWVIIGGGIHGVHLAVRLIGEARIPKTRIRIIDPAPSLLHAWHRCSMNTGMTFLRSPSVHNLDIEPFSLLNFADAKTGCTRRELFKAPYNRPSVQLFSEHCAHVISKYDLNSIHIKDLATDISLSCDGVHVQLEEGRPLKAQRALLAMGTSAHPRSPAWAANLLVSGMQIHHIFEHGFNLKLTEWPERVAVVGAGLSGAQAAIRLATGGRTVHLISRHAIREHQFDSDSGWVGPKNMRGYKAIKSSKKRREVIKSARHLGSIPSDIHRKLKSCIHAGTIQWHTGEVSATAVNDGAVLDVGDASIPVDALLLATGFEQNRPGGLLVDRLITRHALPCSDCGFPVTDKNLRWHPRLYVSGPLAELEIGPVSRNIAGARRAAERIVPAASRR